MSEGFKLPKGFEDAKPVEEAPFEQGGAFEDDAASLLSFIDETMQLPEKPTRDGAGNYVPPTPRREKHRMVCDRVRKVMRKWGTFYNVGNVCTHVPHGTRQNIQVIKLGFNLHVFGGPAAWPLGW